MRTGLVRVSWWLSLAVLVVALQVPPGAEPDFTPSPGHSRTGLHAPADSDRDGLSDTFELRVSGTDPGLADTDGDGLLDGWEVNGYRSPDAPGQVVDLAALGVDPRHKDVIVIVDWTFDDTNSNGRRDEGETTYRPLDAALEAVKGTFAEAPVTNPDGRRGIQLIVRMGRPIPARDGMFVDGTPLVNASQTRECPIFTEAFRRIESNSRWPALTEIARYSLWVDNASESVRSGWAECPIPSGDFIVSLGYFKRTVENHAGTFLHELGHTLGLYHTGFRHDSDRRKFTPNYPSVMNYYHQLVGVDGGWSYQGSACVTGTCSEPGEEEGRLCFSVGGDGAGFDFSRGRGSTVDERDLREAGGLGLFSDPLDLDCDGSVSDAGLRVDLQGDEVLDAHRDHDDWSNLRIAFW